MLGEDVWSKSGSTRAKQLIGALPDGLALPQRLTGAELLTYLGPAWSLKVHIALVVVASTAAVPVLILLAAQLGHLPWLSWVAVPAGIVSGAVMVVYLGGRSVGRLRSQQVRILRVLADAAR